MFVGKLPIFYCNISVVSEIHGFVEIRHYRKCLGICGNSRDFRKSQCISGYALEVFKILYFLKELYPPKGVDLNGEQSAVKTKKETCSLFR